jgi:hypothetical protein
MAGCTHLWVNICIMLHGLKTLIMEQSFKTKLELTITYSYIYSYWSVGRAIAY